MFFSEVEFRNFRNHRRLHFEPSVGVNLLVGENASGKTNILEGLYFLASGRPLRAQRDSELVTWGEDACFLRGRIRLRNGTHLIEIGVQTGVGKQLKVDATKQASLPDGITTVTFSPDDLVIIKGGPAERRRFIDTALSQMRPSYRYQLIRYFKVLGQRNSILKLLQEGRGRREDLDPWDAQLVRFGSWIWERRIEFLRALDGHMRGVYARLTGRSLSVLYRMGDGKAEKPGLEDEGGPEARFAKVLSNAFFEEVKRGASLFGPHRDDLVFLSEGSDLRLFGSQGQQRMAVLALKLAELALLREMNEDEPILLFDDVFSELDEEKKRLLWEGISSVEQAFITGTDLGCIPPGCEVKPAIVKVSPGLAQRWERWEKN